MADIEVYKECRKTKENHLTEEKRKKNREFMSEGVVIENVIEKDSKLLQMKQTKTFCPEILSYRCYL